jgi:hypothetical protein
VSELPLQQLAWPVLYALFHAWAPVAAWRRWRGATTAAAWRTRCLAAFVGLSFLVWMTLFSIYRYLVPVELLAPLLCWLLWHHLVPPRWAGRTGPWVVAAIALVGLGGYKVNWGHAGWVTPPFRVERPSLSPGSAARDTVLLVGAEPMAWRIPFLPAEMAYVGIGTNFPAGPGYAPRVREILRTRGGSAWVMLPAADHRRRHSAAKFNRIAGWLGWKDDAAGCARLRRLQRRFHLRARLVPAAPGPGCRFEPLPEAQADLAAMDRATEQQAATLLAPYGLRLDPADCRRYDSWIGRSHVPYLWCATAPAR